MSLTFHTPPEDEPGGSRAPNIAPIDAPPNPGRIALRFLIAAVVVSGLIGFYFYKGQHKPVATGEVSRLSLFPIHSVLSDHATEGLAGQDEQYDQLIVFAQVLVHNQSDAPLTITEMMGNLTLADGTLPSSRAASPSDFNRLFAAYPKVASLRSEPLLRSSFIAPGANGEGLLIFNYPLSKQQWDQRKAFSISVSFSNGTVIAIDASHA